MGGRRLHVWLASVSAASLMFAAAGALAADPAADIIHALPLPPDIIIEGADAAGTPLVGSAVQPLFKVELPPEAEARFDLPVTAPAPVTEIAVSVPLPPDAPADLAAIPVIAPPAPVTAAPQPVAPEPFVAAAALTREAMQEAVLAFARADLPQGRSATQMQGLRREREALIAYYTARDFQPQWLANGQFSSAAKAVLARLARAGDDGLDLAAYALPAPRGDPASQMEAELRLSEAASAYARQASGSRVDPTRLSLLITSRPNVAESAQALGALLAASDPASVLQAYNPPHKAYAALRAKLAELRQAPKPVAQVTIPAGAVLREGMRDTRVPLIRTRFGLDAPEADGDLVYDAKIAAAIVDFQRANSLPATGVLTPRTIAALSGGEPVRLENEIIANMERWRWMARDLGESRIEVNIPDYKVSVFKQGALVHQARAVVGKPDTPTPVFSDVMRFLIVNPYWNVPQSIIKKEMMPKLAADPDYLRRLGYEVIHKGNSLIVRQPPGERNALGRIKFMFPNDHAVYLHDTPSRALFGAERRAFSHGCVRVDQPFKLAEVLLGRDNGWSEERVRGMIGGAERTVHLATPIPIHIMYFTLSVDEAGNIQQRDDIYGYSRRVKSALGLEGEVFVETPARAAKQRATGRFVPVQKVSVAAQEEARPAGFFSSLGAGPRGAVVVGGQGR